MVSRVPLDQCDARKRRPRWPPRAITCEFYLCAPPPPAEACEVAALVPPLCALLPIGAPLCTLPADIPPPLTDPTPVRPTGSMPTPPRATGGAKTCPFAPWFAAFGEANVA